MANVTAQEQLMLELVNRARLDPLAEAARFGMSLNQGLPAGTITSTPKQALAMNDTLVTAADNHSEYMHLNDEFSHTEVSGAGQFGFTGASPSDRLNFVGYNWSSNGENIAWRGVFPGPIDLTAAIIQQHEDLFRSTTGHRQNLLADAWREVGIGQEEGTFLQNGTQYASSLVTQNFAVPGSGQYFITGVVYQDTVVNDDFYTVGEGQNNVAVSINGGFADVTSTAGGYEAAMTNGTRTVVIGAATVVVQMASRNIKLDFVNGNQLWTDSSLTHVSGAPDIRLLGATNANLTGGGGVEQLVGNRGNNVLTGNGNDDRLFGMDGNDTLMVDAGNDQFNGGNGVDTIRYDGAAAVIIDLAGKVVVGGGLGSDTIVDVIENAIGGTGNNAISGNSAVNRLDGGAGTDTISYYTVTKAVVLDLAGNAGVDGGAGTDTLLNFENANGGAGNDALSGKQSIVNVLNGLGGTDTVSYYSDTIGVVIELNLNRSTQAGVVDTLLNFENANGSTVGDTLRGSAAVNVLNGLGGADTLTGNGANDRFDFIRGQAAGDSITDFAGGGAGAGDSLRFSGYGTVAQGSTFTFVAGNTWQIHSGLFGTNEFITINGGAGAVHATDFIFV